MAMSAVGRWFGSWRLVGWRTAAVVALVVYTLVGFLVVPWVAERVIEKVGREKLGAEITVEEVRCNPFTLTLTVDGLAMPDRSGDPMLSFDRMVANLQASSLFRWAFTLAEVSLENPFVALRRFEDGGINVLELKEAIEPHLDLSDEAFGLPRAILREIRMTGGSVELSDGARPEPLVWTGGPAELTLLDISTIPDAEGTSDIDLGLPGGGSARVDGEVLVEPFALNGTLSVDRIRVEDLWPFVGHKFDLDVRSGVLRADLSYRIALGDEGLRLAVEDLSAEVTDPQVDTAEPGAELLRVASADLSGVSLGWPEARLEVDSVAVEGAAAELWLAPDGTPVWTTLVPEETREELLDLWKLLIEEYSASAVIHTLEIRRSGAAFEDRTFAEPVRVEVSDAAVTVTGIRSEPGTELGLEASALVGGEARGSAAGTVTADPLRLEAEVGIEGLELAPFQPYVARFVPIELSTGSLAASGAARLEAKGEGPAAGFSGELSIRGLDLTETVTGTDLLRWGDLQVQGVEATLAPISVEVAEVDVHEAGVEIAVLEDGSINVFEFLKAIAEDLQNLPEARIAEIELHDCFGTYSESTPSGPFELAIGSVDGSLSPVVTQGSEITELEFVAAIGSGGSARIGGSLDLFDLARATDLDIAVRDVVLPPMSPKSIGIIGHPIEQGLAMLDLDVAITDQQLVSVNRAEIDQLELGERVEGDRLIDLPVKLGVSLLKDKNGRIALDIPVEADVSDPDFLLSAAFRSAFVGVVGEIAKSPFRAIGRMMGGGDEGQDLEFVEFAAGGAELESHVTANLETLAGALAERPELALEIPAVVDPAADGRALRERALAMELVGEPMSLDELAEAAPLEALETRYGADAEALRAQFTSGTDDSPPELDEEAYREALLGRIFETQVVDESALQALGGARAEAIHSYLVDRSGTDGARVRVLSEPMVSSEGEDYVRCQLRLVAVD
jgi:hypothetical protein